MAVSDRKLIEMFNKGNDEVRGGIFEEIVKRYQKKVYNTTYRMMGNPEDANDLAQEVFIRVYQNLHRFQWKASFSTWLFTITSNICRDELRKRQRRLKTQSLSDPIKLKDGEVEREIADDSMTPEKISDHRELRNEIQEVINQLPPEQKEVIVLREFQGFSYEEIAEVSGIAVGTVKSRISRARRSIRKNLKDQIAMNF
ncbi:MAG: sigma-70 family RNA polymerase sigma factor [Halanaerobiales bacterium]|nr:sigma-70 family RNA polymerase sigma factor [Halanaerobiales bacterium]